MALKGSLRDFSTMQLFNLIHLGRKTGTLTLTHGDMQATLGFKDGKLIYAALDGHNDRLVTILERAGRLTKKQVEVVMAQASHRSDKELGLLLINAGYVSQSDIIQSIRNYTLSNVYPLFTWTDGTFCFESGVLPACDRIAVPIDLENVIIEGNRRIKEWERLQEELPDLNLALRLSEQPPANLRTISLTADEWRVISLADSRNTLRQIAEHTGMSEFQVRRIVYGLMQAGLVEIVSPRVSPTFSPAGQNPNGTGKLSMMTRPEAKRNLVLRLIDRIWRL